jgi:aqualysin 1
MDAPVSGTRRTRRRLAALAGSLGLLLLSVMPALANEPPRPAPATGRLAPVVGRNAPGVIADRYIVVLRDGTNAADVKAASRIATTKGGATGHTYTAALNGFSARLSADALAALRRDSRVAFIEADATISLSADQANPPSWGLDRVDQRNRPLNNNYHYDATGSGVRAYIIDTGIRFTHNDFGGRAISGFDAIDGGSADDCNGHGTHVAGTVGGTAHGVAKGVTLVGVRVLNCAGSGTNSQVIAGINWVTSDHDPGERAVANMSLGGGVSTAIDNAVIASINDGVSYSVAAGNDNGANACNGSPGRVAAAITVGSTTSSDARSSFSNIGSCLDMFAPGSGITSAWHTSNSATNTISGTSMATPHVAGAAALWLQNNAWTPQQVRDHLVNTATTGVVTNPGSGSPNRLLYTLGGSSPPPPPPPTGCTGYQQTFTGSLSGAGDADIHPNGTYYQSTVSGQHRGCLDGPNGVDFDLYLYRWNGSRWVQVASGITSAPDELVTYNGTAGYYYWRVVSYSGSGSYTFGMSRP